MKRYSVYYMRPNSFRRFNFGQEFPTVANLGKTHRKVRGIDADNLEDVFSQMQAENWPTSEHGKVKRLGLQHTSMSVGDVAYDIDFDKHFVVAPIGFKEIE